MNAIEMRNRIDSIGCVGLDVWIHTFLYKRFVQSGGNALYLNTEFIKIKGWVRKTFISEMTKRGYIIDVVIRQVPFAQTYYLIELPPGDE